MATESRPGAPTGSAGLAPRSGCAGATATVLAARQNRALERDGAGRAPSPGDGHWLRHVSPPLPSRLGRPAGSRPRHDPARPPSHVAALGSRPALRRRGRGAAGSRPRPVPPSRHRPAGRRRPGSAEGHDVAPGPGPRSSHGRVAGEGEPARPSEASTPRSPPCGAGRSPGAARGAPGYLGVTPVGWARRVVRGPAPLWVGGRSPPSSSLRRGPCLPSACRAQRVPRSRHRRTAGSGSPAQASACGHVVEIAEKQAQPRPDATRPSTRPFPSPRRVAVGPVSEI